MNSSSLKLRLFIAASLAISLSLLIAGSSFYLIFQRYVERVAQQQLENHFVQLVSGIKIDETGKVKARINLSDPRFQKPYGGLYWQIEEDNNPPIRSRSLWDDSLQMPATGRATPGSEKVHVIAGPNNSSLFVLEKNIALPDTNNAARPLKIFMAIDRHDIDETVSNFGRDLLIGLGLLYAALVLASLLQIVVGLRPLEVLRRGVESINLGTAQRIEGEFPSEVRPLIDEVNGLLESRENQLVRARQRASNLAHGLKTPLTVMSAIADNIARAGLLEGAKDIHDGADQMRTLVERELARARIASGQGVHRTLLMPVVNRMINALKKTATNDALLWHSSVALDAQIAMEPGDLLEFVGNLLDNARKWAKSQIYVSWRNGTLRIEDDGPGVPEDQIAKILERGVRLDVTVSGSGLGLGIVSDLAEVYGFELKLERSSLGGLSVSVITQSQPLRMERPA
jgi:signal transduction histidine kinase